VTSALEIQVAPSDHAALRRWISRAFLVSIVVYLVVLGYLVAGSLEGASRWAPYGVNMPAFIALIVGSEVVITITAVAIFRDDAGIWPPAIGDGWRAVRGGSVVSGARTLLVGAWDISIIDLRLRTPRAIALGRANRVAALAPLVYALVASASRSTPWGLRGSALLDIGLTLGVWAFMELVMVRPATDTGSSTITLNEAGSRSRAQADVLPRSQKGSRYYVRRVTEADIPRIEEIERIRWRDEAATRPLIESRLRTYPQGQNGVVHETVEEGRVTRSKLVAWATVMCARQERVHAFSSWDEVSANGTIANCDPAGDVLVGVNLASVTEGALYRIVGETLASTVEWGKARAITGGRLTGFVAFNEQREREGKPPLEAQDYAKLREIRGHALNEHRLDAGLPPLSDDEYVGLVNGIRSMNGEPPLEPQERPDYVCSNVRGYMAIPGTRIVKVAPNYFRDPSSADWGVVIDWTNPLPVPLRRIVPLRRWLARRMRREIEREWEAHKRDVRERAQRRAARRPAPLEEATVAAT
jgi:hypothetical protein